MTPSAQGFRSPSAPHKNASRRSAFDELGCRDEHVRRLSTTHETYRPPPPPAHDHGPQPLDRREKKRKEMEEYLWKTMTEKVLNDMAVEAKSFFQHNQFETTYSSNFQIEGFQPKEIGDGLEEELCAKYPLYNTTGMSVPVNRYECYKAKQSVHKPLAHLFKKDSRFTSRMSDPNDYRAPVAPGHFAYV